MKKVICLLLVFAIIFLSGCTSAEEKQKKGEKILKEYLSQVESFDSIPREFGKESKFIDVDDNMSVAILYPYTEFRSLDKAIEKWIEKTAKYYEKDLKKNGEKESTGKLTIHYESYVIGSSAASIKFTGVYSADYLKESVQIVKTFNYDTDSKDFMKIKDVIKFGQRGNFEELALNKLGIAEDDADKETLDNWLLTPDGIKIFIQKGTYLPEKKGSKTILLKYGDLTKYLRKNFDYKHKNKDLVSVETTKEPENVTQKIDPAKPMIALTFDDGPSAHTPRLLDILKKNNAKATFFIIGTSIEGKEDTIKRIVNEGHEMGNHSWSHRNLTKISKEEVTEQLAKTKNKLFEITGQDCLLARPPYGAVKDVAKSVGKEMGITYINWSVDTLDWKTKDADAVYNKIINNVESGDIVLCHDLHKSTVDAMEKVVPKLIAEGYQLVTVSELLSHSSEPTEAGNVYYKQIQDTN